ncbi:DUF6273 domain-containing protein [Eubacteriaceae bacterium ES2]|nr:DUF6273 domain-containing protein [Eubacteriaceae bacterium ES2]
MTQAISNLAVGSKVKFGNYKVESEEFAPLIWKVADKNHSGYPSNSVSLITESIVDLRGFDAKEPTNTDSNRQSYGNNRFSVSNIDQWLNDNGDSWWAATHTYDATPNDAGMSQPTGYNDKQGFKSYFTADELAAVLDTTIRVVKNTVTDGGSYEDIVRKFYLPSTTEVGLANENSIAEGSVLSIFSAATDASRLAYATQAAITNSLSASKPASTTAAWYWWLRTPYSGSSYSVRLVYSSGALNSSNASYGYCGVRPLCNLSSDILVTDTADSDGCYTCVFTTPHVITLDKAITLTAGDELIKLKFNPKVNGTDMTLQEIDDEKLIFEKTSVGSETISLSITGEDAKIDKIAYTVS